VYLYFFTSNIFFKEKSKEDERAYLDILQQMLSEVLLARHDRSVGVDSPRGVPNLVTGMHPRVNKENHGKRMENKGESYHGHEENEGRDGQGSREERNCIVLSRRQLCHTLG
jgi:hypothetical protein